MKDLNLNADTLPVHLSLGLTWDLNNDNFVFKITDEEKPLTRRGLLSNVNSIFDPIGFVFPVINCGKILLREIVTSGNGWDDELAEHQINKWQEWLTALKAFKNYCISCMIVPTSVSLARQTDIMKTYDTKVVT